MGVFEALADPVRRRILVMLADGEQPSGAIAQALGIEYGISQPAVSQHLKVLRDNVLVQVRVDGNRRIYAIELAGLAELDEWRAQLLDQTGGQDQFAGPLEALATEVARGKRERRRKPGEPRESRAVGE